MYLLPSLYGRGLGVGLLIPYHKYLAIIFCPVPHQFVTALAFHYEAVVVQVIYPFALRAFQPKAAILPLQRFEKTSLFTVRTNTVKNIELTIIQR